MLKKTININGWGFYLSITAINLLLAFSLGYLFCNDNLYYQSFENQFSIERIDRIIKVSNKWQWLGYILIPIIIIIQTSYTAVCLYTGFFLTNLKVRFKDLFKVALLANIIFVLAGLVKLVILIFFKEVNTLSDLQFQPLSLMELFDKDTIDSMFIYPLSLISVFELLYWLSIAWLLTGVVEKPLGSTLKTVASSYGTGLLLWVLFVMFLTVNLS